VKFVGGREVTGILKGSDGLTNLVLDQCDELLRDPEDPYGGLTGQKRFLGLVVCRGTSLMLITPADGSEPIENPFAQAEEEDA
jgi:U6 snRNA-associated Sm-like protein LSm7